MPRNRAHDDLPNLDLRKRAAPIGRREKVHQRMERELTNLKRDKRYWDGDPDYRNYVQRQFERIFDDPSGKPGPLRIGAPKIFATDIEPFEAQRGRRRKPAISGSDGAGRLNVEAGSDNSGLHDPNAAGSLVMSVGKTKPDKLRNANGELDPARRNFSQTGKRPTANIFEKLQGLGDVFFTDRDDPVENGKAKAEETLSEFRDLEWPVAEMLLQHYIDGSGKEVTVSAAFVRNYPTLRLGYRGVFRNLSRWFYGDLVDSQVGAARLPLRDGEHLTIGAQYGRRDVPLDDLVMWESTFKGQAELLIPSTSLHWMTKFTPQLAARHYKGSLVT